MSHIHIVRKNKYLIKVTVCIAIYYAIPSHLSPCRTIPNSSSPQKSQKVGDLQECTKRECGRITSSSFGGTTGSNVKCYCHKSIDNTTIKTPNYFIKSIHYCHIFFTKNIKLLLKLSYSIAESTFVECSQLIALYNVNICETE